MARKLTAGQILVVYPLAVSDQYGVFMTVVLHPEIINQSLHRQINKTARNEEN